MAERDVLERCSECGMSPWNKHCCTCEPCVLKRIERATSSLREQLTEAREDTARLIEKAEAVIVKLVVAPERESDSKPFQYLCDIKAGFPELMDLREAIDKARRGEGE